MLVRSIVNGIWVLLLLYKTSTHLSIIEKLNYFWPRETTRKSEHQESSEQLAGGSSVWFNQSLSRGRKAVQLFLEC